MSSKKSKNARHLGTESDPKAVAQLLKSVLPEIESYSSTSVAAKVAPDITLMLLLLSMNLV